MLTAAPVNVAAPGLTGDALAAVVGVVDATGITLIVWTTTTELLLYGFDTVMVEYLVVVVFSVVVGEMDMTGFEASLTGAIEAEVITGVVFAATGQIVVYRTLVSVVTEPIFAGQSVTVSGQAVIVYVRVV